MLSASKLLLTLSSPVWCVINKWLDLRDKLLHRNLQFPSQATHKYPYDLRSLPNRVYRRVQGNIPLSLQQQKLKTSLRNLVSP